MSAWPSISYPEWSATCDTLHAHTQVLGKLAAELAPPEPQLQHAALRLTARGWETAPLPSPDGNGAFVVALDLHRHEALVETSRRPAPSGAADPEPAGRRGDHGPARRDRRGGGGGEDRLRTAGGRLERPARPGHRARDLRRAGDRRLLRHGDPRGGGPGRLPRALARALDPGQRLVGLLRPRRQPLLRRPGDAALRRLHHAQRDGCPGGRGRLVAGRSQTRRRRLLRLRAPGPPRLRRRRPGRPRGPLGRRPRRVRARVGGAREGRRPPRARPRLRPLRLPPRLRDLRLGPRDWRRPPKASPRRSSSGNLRPHDHRLRRIGKHGGGDRPRARGRGRRDALLRLRLGAGGGARRGAGRGGALQPGGRAPRRRDLPRREARRARCGRALDAGRRRRSSRSLPRPRLPVCARPSRTRRSCGRCRTSASRSARA